MLFIPRGLELVLCFKLASLFLFRIFNLCISLIFLYFSMLYTNRTEVSMYTQVAVSIYVLWKNSLQPIFAAFRIFLITFKFNMSIHFYTMLKSYALEFYRIFYRCHICRKRECMSLFINRTFLHFSAASNDNLFFAVTTFEPVPVFMQSDHLQTRQYIVYWVPNQCKSKII